MIEQPGQIQSTPPGVPPVPQNPELASRNSQLPHPNGPDGQPLFTQARGESDRAAEAFRVYLELGPQRRYVVVGRKVGASLRTVKRWAAAFDWRARIKTHAARRADQFAEAEAAAHREDLLDAALRAKDFRERQYDVAEALLLAAERYLERTDEADLDSMNFADACKALDVASRLGRQAASHDLNAGDSQAKNLRDQLAALLDKAYGESPTHNPDSTAPATNAPNA